KTLRAGIAQLGKQHRAKSPRTTIRHGQGLPVLAADRAKHPREQMRTTIQRLRRLRDITHELRVGPAGCRRPQATDPCYRAAAEPFADQAGPPARRAADTEVRQPEWFTRHRRQYICEPILTHI